MQRWQLRAPSLRTVLLRTRDDLDVGRKVEAKARIDVWIALPICPQRRLIFILGRRDMMTPTRGGMKLAEAIKHSTTVVIDFSGHSLMAEAPDATLDALIEFLRN